MTDASKDSTVLRRGRAKIEEIFGADLRSLAAFRIVLAMLVLADLANRATDLSAHYTDEGVLPRTVLMQELMSPWAFSLNLMNGGAWFQALLFAVTALAALTLLFGYRTHLMTVILWVLVLSIQVRNPMVLSGGSYLLNLLLFWSMFLPLGAYWSVDRALKPEPPRLSMRFLSLATVGLLMQVAFMYWLAAINKSGSEWRVDGTAIYYILSIDQITTPIGNYLYQFPELLKVLTFATVGFEAFGPFLLFCPILTGPVRTAAVFAFMSFQFGTWLMIDIGIFPWLAAFCMLCFLPSWFWEKAAELICIAFPEQPKIVRYLQRVVVSPIHAYWLSFRARLISAVQYSISGVMVDGGRLGNDTKRAPAPATETSRQQDKAQFSHLRPLNEHSRPLTWAARKAAAERRKPHGAVAETEPVVLRSSIVANVLALFFLLYIFLSNLASVYAFTMPASIVPFSSFLGIDQSWNMFASHPPTDDGWYVIPGTLSGGQQVDLMAVTRNDFSLHEGVSWEKPKNVASTFKDEHWQEYLEQIRQDRYANQRLHFGRYICREWNTHHAGDEQLDTFQIIYMLEETLPDYQHATPEQTVLWEHSCF